MEHGEGGASGAATPEPEGKLVERVASLESGFATIADLVIDNRTLRDNARSDYRVLFGAIIASALGIAGLIARVATRY